MQFFIVQSLLKIVLNNIYLICANYVLHSTSVSHNNKKLLLFYSTYMWNMPGKGQRGTDFYMQSI